MSNITYFYTKLERYLLNNFYILLRILKFGLILLQFYYPLLIEYRCVVNNIEKLFTL